MTRLENQGGRAGRVPPPRPSFQAITRGAAAILGRRSVLESLAAIHSAMGDIFEIRLFGFQAVFLVGPEANRFVLVTGRDRFLWRNEKDPVADLLGEGLLVVDGAQHDALRGSVKPALHKKRLAGYGQTMVNVADQVAENIPIGEPVDIVPYMREIALAILMRTVFGQNFWHEITGMRASILRVLRYISPGLWLIYPSFPRPGYRSARDDLDAYLYRIIRQRREFKSDSEDVLDLLIADLGKDDHLIRDQLLTLLIAGHDTSTAMLSWALYLIGQNPKIYDLLSQEVNRELKGAIPSFENINTLDLLERVVFETLRLYPPIHLGSRIAARDFLYKGYWIKKGSRVVYSIYLTHRHPGYWLDPDRFFPNRFIQSDSIRDAYRYLPFGGGARNCLGYAFANLEARIVLARWIQRFRFEFCGHGVRAHMGATLQPHPGVWLRIHPKKHFTAEQ